jgi:ATP-dependent Lon protease
MLLKNIMESDIETGNSVFMSFINTDEDGEINDDDNNIPKEIFILPVKNVVIYPGIIIPITAVRFKSIQLLQDAYKSQYYIGVVTQKNSNDKNLSYKDLYTVGSISKIFKILKITDGYVSVILQGKQKFQINKYITKLPYFKAQITPLEEFDKPNDKEYISLLESIKELFINILQDSPYFTTDMVFYIRNIDNPPVLLSFISSNMNFSVHDKQEILNVNDLKKKSNFNI